MFSSFWITDSEKLEGRSDGSQFSHSKLGDENGDNLKSKGVLTNLKVPTDLSSKKLSFGANWTPVACFVPELQVFLSMDK